ncbi:serine/threonine kinase [Labilithrix luteola]|uniref:Serine/threonine kinase n=1 Tax=Labilithrix luteola TaxID=1391654 RepID=A0A0K1PX61_9BACT|nr:SUMF1/EgtB/PvdO family nonheme iron enzyme [Labilithrix luteola]AKU97709.1 serine/threonine kinase [Labilithrix luteola]
MTMRIALGSMILLAATASSVLSCSRELPPFGQLHLTVSTDGPVPSVVSRLRIDVYRSDGRWIDSHDQPLRSRSDWPTSFTVYASDTRMERVRIRLRAYASDYLRDYRGERYQPPPPDDAALDFVPDPPVGDEQPRLFLNGVDVTPRSEPAPGVTIDRLMWVALDEGSIGSASIVLRIACAGTMADLAGDRTCIDDRNVLHPTPVAANDDPSPAPWALQLEEDLNALPEPRSASMTTDGTPLFDEEVMVPGAPFVLGSNDESVRFSSGGKPLDTVPARVFVAPPLLVDRYEMTVARYREALAHGFRTRFAPAVNDSPGIEQSSDGVRACTFSTNPFEGAASRETMPLSCIPFPTAVELCEFLGGDLPTEAEWEYLATSAGKDAKTAYPWGNEIPSCDEAVYGRIGTRVPAGGKACAGPDHLYGPLPVDAGSKDSTPAGIHGMAANVGEFARDGFHDYRAACWALAPIYDPSCPEDANALAIMRGSAFLTSYVEASVLRRALPTTARNGMDGGLRCVRRR